MISPWSNRTVRQSRFSYRPVAGWETVVIDPATSTVRVPTGVELDLGATAKALCADRAANRAGERTGSGVLVSLGGDVAVAGPAPEQGWPVRITDHHADPLDRRRPRRHHHVWWPGHLEHLGAALGARRTCPAPSDRPVDRRAGHRGWRTVSVAAGSCLDANIASCAAVIMGAVAPAVAGSPGAAGPPGRRRRRGAHSGGMAGRGTPVHLAAVTVTTNSRALWYLTRGFGLVALILLTVTMVARTHPGGALRPARLAPFRHLRPAQKRLAPGRGPPGRPRRHLGARQLRPHPDRRHLHPLRVQLPAALVGPRRPRPGPARGPAGHQPAAGAARPAGLAGRALGRLRLLAAGGGARPRHRFGHQAGLGAVHQRGLRRRRPRRAVVATGPGMVGRERPPPGRGGAAQHRPPGGGGRLDGQRAPAPRLGPPGRYPHGADRIVGAGRHAQTPAAGAASGRH